MTSVELHGDIALLVDVSAVPGHLGRIGRARTRRGKLLRWALTVAKRIQAGQACCIKKNRGLAARFLREEFSSKIVHLKSNRRRVDDAGDLLCNIRSSIGAGTNGADTMVTAALQPDPRVANADTVDRADAPEMPGLVGGGALAAKDRERNRQVNHADAPHEVQRRSGTDLAQLILLNEHRGSSAPDNGGPPAR
jgi:hypothetical protein